jgi:hypothetical protein
VLNNSLKILNLKVVNQNKLFDKVKGSFHQEKEYKEKKGIKGNLDRDLVPKVNKKVKH